MPYLNEIANILRRGLLISQYALGASIGCKKQSISIWENIIEKVSNMLAERKSKCLTKVGFTLLEATLSQIPSFLSFLSL